MNRYYTETIPADLARALKEKGMPIEVEGENVWCPSYAEVFDWYAEQGFYISIHSAQTPIGIGFYPSMNHVNFRSVNTDTWHKAADAAINRVLELITE